MLETFKVLNYNTDLLRHENSGWPRINIFKQLVSSRACGNAKNINSGDGEYRSL